jgi:subfamily B ATP-binding cassette protein MsbA
VLLQIICILLRFLRPYPWVLPCIVVLGTVASLAEGLGIGLLIPLLDTLMSERTARPSILTGLFYQYAAIFPEDVRLIAISGTIVGLVMIKSIVHFSYLAILTWSGSRIAHDLRVALFDQLLSVSYQYIAQQAQGTQINALEGQTYRAGQAVLDLSLLLVNLCTAAILTVLLLFISWPMTLLIMGGVALAGAAMRWLVTSSQRLGRQAESSNGALQEIALQALNGMRIIRIFGQERRERARFEAVSNRLWRGQRWLEFTWRAMQPLVDLLYVPLLLGALLVAWYADVGLPILLPFLLLVFRLQRYLRDLDSHRVCVAAHAAPVAEVAALLDRRDKPYLAPGYVPFQGFEERIVFDRVGFAYDEVAQRRPALADVSLEIRRGETIALVGGTGAGKSTLINLLCRLYDPTAGEIGVDGIRLADIDLASWRRRIAIAGQDAELLGGTIRDNIAYGDPDADHARIVQAAEQASINSFVESLPQRYDSLVGTRGMQLSGGERQRISLARALLRRPDILILDEATNAIDHLTEAAIQRALEQLAGRLTIIIIAHRLSTIRWASRVVVMKEGRIVDQGTRLDLLQRPGLFAELHGLESEGIRAPEPALQDPRQAAGVR